MRVLVIGLIMLGVAVSIPCAQSQSNARTTIDATHVPYRDRAGSGCGSGAPPAGERSVRFDQSVTLEGAVFAESRSISASSWSRVAAGADPAGRRRAPGVRLS